jgi:tetratricopeptide (TPR) repeat protein
MYWLSRAYKRSADLSFALLIEQFSGSGRAHEFLGESNQLREAYDDAVPEYQAAIRLRPGDPELHEKLSQVYLEKKLFAEADQELRQAVALDPGRARSLYLLGHSCLSQHHDRESLPYLQQALRIDPRLLEAHAALGQAYMRLKEPERALPELEKAGTIDFHGDLHYLLYVAYRSVGKNDMAQKALARSQELRHSLIGKHQARIAEMVVEQEQ